MSTHLILGQEVLKFNITPRNTASGDQKPASFALSTSDYSVGYVARAGANTNLFFACPKAVGDFDVIISGHSADGTMISAEVLESVSVDPVPEPQADEFVTSNQSVVPPDITTPDDPGNATVTGSL